MTTKPLYPMQLLPVKALLQLSEFVSHDQLLEKGLLQQWTPEKRGKVIFVSHQWLGYSAADPDRQHFSTLKRVLQRLLNGEIDKVETMLQGLQPFQNVVVHGKEWQEKLPGMYIWIDYSCMPQVSSTSSQAELKQVSAAVRSLPSYVERCDLMLILVPVCLHADTGHPCNYASWRSRGWCRLELLFGMLAQKTVNIMVCRGEEAQPEFIHPFDCLWLQVGKGRFTCCDLGHELPDGRVMPCDKERVRNVLEDMLKAKVKRLSRLGKRHEMRYFLMLRRRLLEGLPLPSLCHAWSGNSTAALASLRLRLKWTEEDDQLVSKGNPTLLLWACTADDLGAVKELLSTTERKSFDATLWQHYPHLPGMLKGLTPLMAAMCFGSFATVEALLEARADPKLQMSERHDALTAAIYCRNVDNVKQWLRRFPEWDLTRQVCFMGTTPLAIAVSGDDCSVPLMKELLSARADINHRSKSGISLAVLAANKEDSDPDGMAFLLDKLGSKVVHQAICPTTWKWSAAFRTCRLLARCNSSEILKEIATWEGCVPLHAAARRGDITMIKILLDVNANPSHRNAQGKTPLDFAEMKFGGKAPQALRSLLDTELQSKTVPAMAEFPVSTAVEQIEQVCGFQL